MKKILLTAGILLTMTVAGTATAAEKSIPITQNGKTLAAQAIVYDETILLPVRAYFAETGGEVQWQANTQTVDIDAQNVHILLEPASNRVFVNGQEMVSDDALQSIDGKTYLSLDLLATILDYTPEYLTQNDQSVLNLKTYRQSIDNDGIAQIHCPALLKTQPETHYFQPDAQHLLKIQTEAAGLQITALDLAKGTVSANTIALLSAVNHLANSKVIGDTIELTIDHTQPDANRIGAATPAAHLSGTAVETPDGVYHILPAQRRYSQITLDTAGGLLTNTIHSQDVPVIDTAYTAGADEGGVYAAIDDQYAFLIGGQFILLDNDQRLPKASSLGSNITQSYILPAEDQFLIANIEGNALYLALCTTDGDFTMLYSKIKSFPDRSVVKILDAQIQNGKAYFILRTSWENYLAVFDLNTQTYSQMIIDSIFTSFLPTNQTLTLFGQDTEAIYLQPLTH